MGTRRREISREVGRVGTQVLGSLPSTLRALFSSFWKHICNDDTIFVIYKCQIVYFCQIKS